MAGQVDSNTNSDTATSACNNELLMATMPTATASASTSTTDEITTTTTTCSSGDNNQSSSLPEHLKSHSSNDTTKEMELKCCDSMSGSGASDADGTMVSFT